jgi:hypothetical protein
VNVAVEVPLPGAAIEVGLKPTLTPVGAPVAVNPIVALNPFRAEVLTVDVPDAPCAAEAAAPEIEKSAAGVTVRFTVAVCIVSRPVPVIVIG